jgi:tRNA modification GTPase
LSVDNPATIAAIATAPGQAAIGIVRISGPEAFSIAQALWWKPDQPFQPGRIYHGWIVDRSAPEATGKPALVDEVVALFFRGPNSYTGEDVVEFQGHGGDFLLQRILNLCFEAGALPAPPGEFTKRAFLAGKMDLTQAESVMDLIAARGDAMARLATANLRARTLGRQLERMREAIIAVQAQIVASVDFPDEVDEPERSGLVLGIRPVLSEAQAMAAASRRNRFVREGLKVAILGQPNAGKSSLFNALLASERAIVTEIAGTTRDVLTETLHVAGVPLTLMDTAGIREADNVVERLGIERTWLVADEAHLVLYLVEARQLIGLAEGVFPEPDAEPITRLPQGTPRLMLANKSDLMADKPLLRADVMPISALTGEGMAELIAWLSRQIRQLAGGEAEADRVALNHRQTACLERMIESLMQAESDLAEPSLPLDVVTVPLTDALRQLDALMGRDTAEEVLDSVFSQFCVGK